MATLIWATIFLAICVYFSLKAYWTIYSTNSSCYYGYQYRYFSLCVQMKVVKDFTIMTAMRYIVFVVFFGSIEYAYYRIAPVSSWIEYHRIEPTQQTFKLWSKPVFLSFSTIKRAVAIEWSDVLRCKITEWWDFVFYSDYRSWTPLAKKKQLATAGRWRQYNIPWPDVPSICYLESYHTILLPYGIRRTGWPIISDLFLLK